jgi:DHA2 family multidrug resistance protein
LQAEASMRAAGNGDPTAAAIAQLTRRMQVEAAVMTFNNLFLAMAICFAVMILLVPMLKRPAPANAGAAKEAH